MTFFSARSRLSLPGGVVIALGTALLMGCSSMTGNLNQAMSSADRSESAPESAEALIGDAAAPASGVTPAPSPPASVASHPQLVKQANLTLVLTDLEPVVESVQQMIDQAQGDLLSRQDRRSPQGVAHHISLTLRVPQEQLDGVLAEIRDLGTVKQQVMTAEDVSDQLVDLEARLKNLRKSEEVLLGIMERSGDISDVLEVSRELSTVRDSIERLAAQQQSLRRQVAYSYIYLTLTSPNTATAPLRPVGETLGNSWQAANRSVRGFTVAGLKLSLWLLAYSPYILLVVLIAFGLYRLRHPRPIPTAEGDGDQA